MNDDDRKTDLESNPIWQIESILQPDEVLLWTGAPFQGIDSPHLWFASTTYRGFFWVVIGMGVVLGFRRFYTASPKVAAALLIFAVIGLTLKVLVFDPRRRGSFYYALTDQRAIVVAIKGDIAPRSVLYRDIDFLNMDEFAPGLGTIECFASGNPGWGTVSRQWGTKPLPLFDSIADAPAVYAVLSRLVPVKGSA